MRDFPRVPKFCPLWASGGFRSCESIAESCAHVRSCCDNRHTSSREDKLGKSVVLLREGSLYNGEKQETLCDRVFRNDVRIECSPCSLKLKVL